MISGFLQKVGQINHIGSDTTATKKSYENDPTIQARGLKRGAATTPIGTPFMLIYNRRQIDQNSAIGPINALEAFYGDFDRQASLMRFGGKDHLESLKTAYNELLESNRDLWFWHSERLQARSKTAVLAQFLRHSRRESESSQGVFQALEPLSEARIGLYPLFPEGKWPKTREKWLESRGNIGSWGCLNNLEGSRLGRRGLEQPLDVRDVRHNGTTFRVPTQSVRHSITKSEDETKILAKQGRPPPH